MEIDYTYTYLLANTAELLVWLAFFFWRRDTRKEMLWMSVIFGIAGLISEPIYTMDWWHPLTVTGTTVGIEDFLFGFWVGGIASVAYQLLFRKILRPLQDSQDISDSRLFVRFSIWVFMSSALFIFAFFITGMNSFYTALVVLVSSIILIWYKRRDLIFGSIISGFLICIIGYLWFLVPEIVTPGWVQSHWYLDNLSGVMLQSVPIEDVIWGFFSGMLIGPLYKFMRAARLVDLEMVRVR